jgi:hypothetical protein
MIRVGKYDYKTKTEPATHGYVNILIHTTGGLSPYVMKDDNGVIMENYWQFSKIWEEVDAITQPLSRYNPTEKRWVYGNEVHLKNGIITDAYWDWREKGMTHNRWVRYPNGYDKHSKAVGTVIGTRDNYEIIGYIEARKRVYYQKYREIAVKTALFKKLKKMVDNGTNIQINEVDGPAYYDEYPYNVTQDGSLPMTIEILEGLMNNPRQAFGHGYSLAACLMGIDF